MLRCIEMKEIDVTDSCVRYQLPLNSNDALKNDSPVKKRENMLNIHLERSGLSM